MNFIVQQYNYFYMHEIDNWFLSVNNLMMQYTTEKLECLSFILGKRITFYTL